MGNKSSSGGAREDIPPAEERAPTQAELSYFQMAKIGYEQLVHAIIRPPRCEYTLKHLGPPVFSFAGRNIKRKDFELHNMRDLLVACSMWEPEIRGDEKLPCVIYMHGNSSARVEALPQLTLALALGCTFLAFDFAGSGLSEGEYVSLGYFERDDLQVVIEYVRGTGMSSSIALWGRSMGAATALMHGEGDPSIGAMILDSSFADLTMLAESMVDKGKEQGYSVPSFVVKLAIRFIRNSVLKTAHFDIKELSPMKHVEKCFIPALFAAGGGDKFVPPSHSQLLHDAYAGEKSIHIVDGDHNTPRPADFFHIAAVFLITALSIPEEKISREGLGFAGSGMGAWTVGKRMGRMRSMGLNPVSAVEGALVSGPSHSSEGLSAGDGGLNFDELLAMSLMDGDLDIGMTPERQAEMQRSLMSMLGDRRQLEEPVAQQSKRASRSIKLSADAPPPVPPAAVVMPPPPSSKAATAEDSNVQSKNNENHGSHSYVSDSELDRWACTLCTLLNHPTVVYCQACETPRES